MARDAKNADIIRDLHAALSGDMLPDTNNVPGNYYNSATGTLYCTLDGKRVAETELENAAKYFRNAAKTLQQSGLEEKRKKADYCILAADALEQIIKNS